MRYPTRRLISKVMFVEQLLLNGVGKIDRKSLQAQARELREAERTASANPAVREGGK
jgi:long-chain acyl-CoA synthetase